MSKPLDGQVALVAGATRGAGRGIARELALAGATVWCTGRSTRGAPGMPGRPETIEETAEIIAADGGQAIAVRVDHTVEAEVVALAERVKREAGRLDILVNDIWGGDPLIDWSQSVFWKLDLAPVQGLIDQAVLTHLITARHFAPMMVEAKRGLIVEITDGWRAGYRGHLLYDLVKSAVIRLAYAMAWDLARTGVTALALSPGFLRSEAMLEGFGVTEANWRDATVKNPDFAWSETPRFTGRAVAALAADPDVRARAGAAFCVDDLADEYGFDDVDGARPNFWRSFEAWVAADEAAGASDPAARLRLAQRYMSIHLTPARAPQAHADLTRLGWTLGEGLRPITKG
jgi:NAD(P)-dependent dehydrogenase (short-subunit alcohol dehydrogenase family)